VDDAPDESEEIDPVIFFEVLPAAQLFTDVDARA
jgi:hypothetical protein